MCSALVKSKSNREGEEERDHRSPRLRLHPRYMYRSTTGTSTGWTSLPSRSGEAVAFAVAGFGPQAARLGPTAAAAADPLLADSDLANPDELSVKVAVVRRGGCPFRDKARRAQAA